MNAVLRVWVVGWMLVGLSGNLSAQMTTLIPFEIEDQFEVVHRDTDYAGRILIVIGSDRGGSEFNAGWGVALTEALEEEEHFDRIAFLPLADLTGVPFFVKGMVRGRFPTDPEQWVAMDWDGVFDEAYTFIEDSSNIFVFTPQGQLLQRAHGQEVDETVLQSLLSPIRVLLSAGGGSPLL